MIIILQPPFLFSEREVIMDEKQNIDEFFEKAYDVLKEYFGEKNVCT